MEKSQRSVEMVVRPTGLVDPEVEVRPTEGQVDDLVAELRKHAEKGQRSLVTTLTKRFAEDLTDYLKEFGIRVRYIHSDLDAIERIDVLRDLRLGEFDVLVGINLLREGLDLPEVAFIGILDADKEGYLRAFRSFIQIIGRAARNVEGHVVMYADKVTDSMRQALDETDRRRTRQLAYNQEHGITPASVQKAIYSLQVQEKDVQADAVELLAGAGLPREDLLAIVRDLEKEMKRLSRELAFEDAARVRDRIIALRKRLAGEGGARRPGPQLAPHPSRPLGPRPASPLQRRRSIGASPSLHEDVDRGAQLRAGGEDGVDLVVGEAGERRRVHRRPVAGEGEGVLHERPVEAGGPLAGAQPRRGRAVVDHVGDPAGVHVGVERVRGLDH
jgi:superfamily II DNA/RNA helicase